MKEPTSEVWANAVRINPLSPASSRLYIRIQTHYDRYILRHGRDPLAATSIIAFLGESTKRGRTALKSHFDFFQWQQVGQGIDLRADANVMECYQRLLATATSTCSRNLQIITPRDLATILDSLKLTRTGHRNRAMLLLCYCGGATNQELDGLRRADVRRDDEGAELILRKGKRERHVRLPYYYKPSYCPAQALFTWMNIHDDEYIFKKHQKSTWRGIGMSWDGIITYIVRQAGLPHATASASSLRRGFILEALARKVDDVDIRRQVGISHSTMERWRQYFESGVR